VIFSVLVLHDFQILENVVINQPIHSFGVSCAFFCLKCLINDITAVALTGKSRQFLDAA
jgi:hypothetical protein